MLEVVIEQPSNGRGSTSTTCLALALLTVSVLPLFFVASHTAALRQEFGWSLSTVGLSISGFYLVSAVASIPAGLLSERLGVPASARITAVGSAALLITLSALPSGVGWWAMALILSVAGLFLALGQTTSSAMLARGVRPLHQGLAFGVRQTAIPVATFFVGATVLVWQSWRIAFLVGLVPAVATLSCVQLMGGRRLARSPTVRRGRGGPAIGSPGLRVLGVAAVAAGSAGSAISTFYLQAMIGTGRSASVAASWLVAGSVVGIMARPAWGFVADRLTDPQRLLIWLVGLGAVGVGLLAAETSTPVLALGTLLAFSCGWAWTGILALVAVRSSPHAPAAASGLVSTGNFAGGAIGPLLFAVLASHASYRVAWLACGLLFSIGVVLALTSWRMLAAAARSPASVGPSERPQSVPSLKESP